MHWPRTLSLYVSREVVQYTLIGLAAITVVMVTRSFVQELDKLIGAGLELDDLMAVSKLIFIMLTVFALPVAFLFGVLLAIGRMAADVEIVAMRACGIGLRGILTPILILGALLSAFTLWLSLDVEPAAQVDMGRTVRRMLMRGAAVEPGQFNMLGDRMLYVDGRDSEGNLHGVVIYDQSDPERSFVVFAETGSMELDEAKGELALRLDRGDVHLDASKQSDDAYHHARFERLEYRIDVTERMDPMARPRARTLSLEQLKRVVARIEAGDVPEDLREDPPSYATNLHKRFATPAAPLLFAMVGVPLGMSRKRGARSYGVILCAGLAFGYYALLSFGELLATERGVPPVLAVWMPNAVYAALACVLLVRVRRSL